MLFIYLKVRSPNYQWLFWYYVSYPESKIFSIYFCLKKASGPHIKYILSHYIPVTNENIYTRTSIFLSPYQAICLPIFFFRREETKLSQKQNFPKCTIKIEEANLEYVLKEISEVWMIAVWGSVFLWCSNNLPICLLTLIVCLDFISFYKWGNEIQRLKSGNLIDNAINSHLK